MPSTSGATAPKSGKTKTKTAKAAKSAEGRAKISTGVRQPAFPKKRTLSDVWDYIAVSWVQAQSAVRKQWPKLTDEDILEIQGQRENLLKKVEMHYGLMEDEAEAELDKWAEHAEF